MDFLFILLPIAFVLLLFNSQRKRTRAAAALQEQIAPGATICTTSGLFGTVVSLSDTRVRAGGGPRRTSAFRPPGDRTRRTVGAARRARPSRSAPDRNRPNRIIPTGTTTPPEAFTHRSLLTD